MYNSNFNVGKKILNDNIYITTGGKKVPKPHFYLSLQVLHRLLKCLRGSPLMVTQYGHSSIGPVVGQDLGWNVLIRYKDSEYNQQSVCKMTPSRQTLHEEFI